MPDDKPKDLPTRSPDASTQAREQADQYDSVFQCSVITFDDGSTLTIPPHPALRLLDDDQQADYDQLMFESESYARADNVEIPEQKVWDRSTKRLVTTLPAQSRPGALLVPYRTIDENGKATLLKPSWEVQTVRAALGEEKYAILRAGLINGERGAARDVWNIWNEQDRAVTERRAADPKSGGGSVDLAPVPEADSPGSTPVPPAEDR